MSALNEQARTGASWEYATRAVAVHVPPFRAGWTSQTRTCLSQEAPARKFALGDHASCEIESVGLEGTSVELLVFEFLVVDPNEEENILETKSWKRKMQIYLAIMLLRRILVAAASSPDFRRMRAKLYAAGIRLVEPILMTQR